jgi:hypothetical protein
MQRQDRDGLVIVSVRPSFFLVLVKGHPCREVR